MRISSGGWRNGWPITSCPSPAWRSAPSGKELVERRIGEWEDLKRWFFGDGGQEAELVYLQNTTNETIRKITRFAQRLGETVHHMRSRRADYLHLAKWFTSLKPSTRHTSCPPASSASSAPPSQGGGAERDGILGCGGMGGTSRPVILKPRITAYRERVKPNAADDHTARNRAVRETYLRRKERIAIARGTDPAGPDRPAGGARP